MNRQINPDHCYEVDGVVYRLEPVPGTPEWRVLKNGERYRLFSSLMAARSWCDHVLQHPASDGNPYRKGSDEHALREAAPALAALLREQGIIK